MELVEIERIERQHYATVCAVSETGGLSAVEVVDELARNASRALHAARQALSERDELRGQVERLRLMASAAQRAVIHLPAS